MITFPRLRRSHGLHAADTLTAAPRSPGYPRAVPEVAHEEPHGIARPEVLARIQAQAEAAVNAAAKAAAAGTATEPWDKPADLMTDGRDAFTAMPRNRVPHSPRRIPQVPRRANTPAAVARDWLGQITYPAYDGTPESYAAVMRRISAVTGTASSHERPGAWARHAIEAGTERAA